MDTALDDQLLVEQARSGDPRAFRALVTRHEGRVRAAALRIVKDPTEASDIAQEAFLRAHQHLADFQGGSSFSTWIHRITTNLSIDHLRKAGRGAQVAFDDEVALDGGSSVAALAPRRLGFDPVQALANVELRERLQKALDHLGVQHQIVLLLREVDGLSYKEMAEVLECAEGTIMSRLFHARKKMQDLLRAYVEG